MYHIRCSLFIFKHIIPLEWGKTGAIGDFRLGLQSTNLENIKRFCGQFGNFERKFWVIIINVRDSEPIVIINIIGQTNIYLIWQVNLHKTVNF